jgi:hypothetical protein
LLARGVSLLGGSPNCVLCGNCVELENHPLFVYPFAWAIWVEVYRCFGVDEVLSCNIWVLLGSFLSSLNWGKKAYKGILMIWYTVAWALWWTMNEKIFLKKMLCDVFDRIKCTSWKWLLAKKVNSPCMFYEWHVNTFDYEW